MHFLRLYAPVVDDRERSVVITFTSEPSAARTRCWRPDDDNPAMSASVGSSPQGVGQWVYVETIGGVDFADRYYFTHVVV